MKTIYLFYSRSCPEEVLEYHSDEWNKEEMEQNVIYEQFTTYRTITREKWINGVCRYSAPFHLENRRLYPNRLSPYRRDINKHFNINAI